MNNIIRGLRNLKGYTQEELAKELGMALRTFHVKEKNPSNFKVSEVKKLAQILEVSPAIFFEDEVTVKVT